MREVKFDFSVKADISLSSHYRQEGTATTIYDWVHRFYFGEFFIFGSLRMDLWSTIRAFASRWKDHGRIKS